MQSMAYLLITMGEEAGRRFALGADPVTAGRHPTCDIQILDPKVSRRHFLIRTEQGQRVLVALESLNGVYLNGTQIEGAVVLHDRDKIQLGDTTLRFRIGEGG